ncbi:MAG TPA: chloride channel protein [Vicinamibacterales bacterium]|nr:chloride channel protein [Vicinamibacterales bacterium]
MAATSAIVSPGSSASPAVRGGSIVTTQPRLKSLGDFTTTARVIPISALAIVIGIFTAFVAKGLLALIGLFTNLFFFQRIDTTLVSPAGHHLGPFVVVVPVIGGLIIGLMARYGSERIRGHGIPEAIEAILINGSRVEPKVAILKPVSSAVSIGSGGPFGAEGPIIMTGGAFGSLIAQFFHLTAAERKTLLVAGAAGGMAATFAAPIASVMLAVELLLFEWKPRSVVPVALASVTATVVRRYLLGYGPLFPTYAHALTLDFQSLLGCVLVGLIAGGASCLLTLAVYASEDAFFHLPIHWMWWPAIGGLVIGLGGLLFPQALGVGYDVIGGMLQTDMPTRVLFGVLIVKSTIWAVSLGSGTSGGVLAPLLMMGGALGGLEAKFLPAHHVGFWPLVSMAAILGGTMRSPLTGVIFALELTQDVHATVPLLLAVTMAHLFTVLTLKRSILTEKVARRGYHLSREYSVDPLEIIFAREVVRTNVHSVPIDATPEAVGKMLDRISSRPASTHETRIRPQRQQLFPVVDSGRQLAGVVTRSGLRHWLDRVRVDRLASLRDVLEPAPAVTYDDEPLRVVVYRMAETGRTRMPVVSRDDGTLVGLIALADLLKARTKVLEAEHRRERVLGMHLFPAVFRR